jgi:hypothetical protein
MADLCGTRCRSCTSTIREKHPFIDKKPQIAERTTVGEQGPGVRSRKPHNKKFQAHTTDGTRARGRWEPGKVPNQWRTVLHFSQYQLSDFGPNRSSDNRDYRTYPLRESYQSTVPEVIINPVVQNESSSTSVGTSRRPRRVSKMADSFPIDMSKFQEVRSVP